MSNLPTQDENNTIPKSDEIFDSLTEVAKKTGEVIADTQVPKEIREGIGAAFRRLCIAYIDPFAAGWEGKGAERRAESANRIRIMNEATDQICRQMNVDTKYAIVAADKYSERVVREQLNIDKVVSVAADEVKSRSYENYQIDEGAKAETPPIDDDWFNTFEKEACQKSSDNMQKLFGKVLATKIVDTSAFSIKTLKLISQLDFEVALLFKRLCSLSISLYVDDVIVDARVLAIGRDPNTNGLMDFGLDYKSLSILEEYGLIVSNYNSWRQYIDALHGSTQECKSSYIMYQNEKYGLVFDGRNSSPQDSQFIIKGLQLYGVRLTISGMELMSIIDLDLNEAYTNDMHEFLSNHKLTLKSFN